MFNNVDTAKPFQRWLVENLTATRAPLLKIYYWESFDIVGLNRQLNDNATGFEHNMHVPTRQINSKSLKFVFWLRNMSSEPLQLNLRRIKNCSCEPLETRVGFNQFRKLYHCPHRGLVSTRQELIYMKPNDLVALSVLTHFYLFGDYVLSFEINASDGRNLLLHFHLDIIGFDPQKCILTKELIDTNIKEFRRFLQPIWVHNITMQNVYFVFSSRDRGFKLINTNLTVPRQSVWPLMVEYRPSCFENVVNLGLLNCDMRTKLPIRATGIISNDPPNEIDVPLEDYECADFLYVIYPNRLEFNTQLGEDRSLMVAIHNYDQKCMEFRWQNYLINDLFGVTYEPEKFRLKPHHSKLVVVKVRVYQRALFFRRIPCVLEVHRIFDKSTKIAKELLDEIESIDDPKWKEDSYVEHVFLHLNVKVNFKEEQRAEPLTADQFILDTADSYKNVIKSVRVENPCRLTIFEKLFWEYLSESDFMREKKIPKSSDLMDYTEVINAHILNPKLSELPEVNKNVILNVVSQLIAESMRDLSKNWRFIPREMAGE